MTGRTERQYRRRAHYPARINFGITNELRAALETLADKADTCVAEVARDCIEAGLGAVRARLRFVPMMPATCGSPMSPSAPSRPGYEPRVGTRLPRTLVEIPKTTNCRFWFRPWTMRHRVRTPSQLPQRPLVPWPSSWLECVGSFLSTYREHSAIIRAMNPLSGSASLAGTS